MLEERDLVVLHVDERSPAEQHQDRGATSAFRTGARRRDVVEVTRTLAALLPAGLPLARALGAASNLAHGAVAARLDQVRARVERGDSLATALAEHADVFPPVYVGLVRAGERSGDLDGAFLRLAEQLEREEQLRAKLASAMVYPAVLALVGGAAVLVLFLFVLPRFAELLGGAGAALPRSTAMLIALSDALRRYWPALLAIPAVIVGLALWARTSTEGARLISATALATPLLGELRRQALAARFARLAAVLLRGGAPLLAALDDAHESLGDPAC
jgi:general secretion pathway protein F